VIIWSAFLTLSSRLARGMLTGMGDTVAASTHRFYSILYPPDLLLDDPDIASTPLP